jgi:riboflavin kinase / FMN adenylyltransferase
MQVVERLSELRSGDAPVSAAIGMFDGVHLGHQRIIGQTVATARALRGLSLVITFRSHPATIIAPDRVPPLIQPLSARLDALTALGVDAVWVIQFDEDFRRLSGERFIRDLAQQAMPLKHLCIGHDFVFGHNRSGDFALLQRLGPELGFSVAAAEPVQSAGQIISSTRIREAVRNGDFARAAAMLGRTYELVGRIVRGDQIGHQIGFPTANLDVRGLTLPPHGVYATQARLGDEQFPSVTNIGLRPTLAGKIPSLHVEAHLLGQNRDLYGKEIALRFVARIREEQRFGSLDELKAQIGRDAEKAGQILGKAVPGERS